MTEDDDNKVGGMLVISTLITIGVVALIHHWVHAFDLQLAIGIFTWLGAAYWLGHDIKWDD